MKNEMQLLHGDCLERLKELPDNSVDSVVTDPPYGLSFMGKKWDYDVPSVEVWAECLRVLKPGGHLLVFAGTRTQHRMAVRIEDAGFEIRDMIAWVYGSGFPKSLDVSKAIDKAAGALQHESHAFTVAGRTDKNLPNPVVKGYVPPPPATPDAARWQGWGTALKPALEPITVARKPLIGTVAENVLTHGTGGLNIDGCRVATDPSVDDPRLGGNGSWSSEKMAKNVYEGGYKGEQVRSSPLGRFPANFIHDGSEEPIELMGPAARFFYCAKASKRDRDDGLDHLPQQATAAMQGNLISGQRLSGDGKPIATPVRANTHPTVKPTDLMRYLCRLITPPGGVVLDPFMGSGSTGKATMLEGFQFIGIEREAEYMEIAKSRIEAAKTLI